MLVFGKVKIIFKMEFQNKIVMWSHYQTTDENSGHAGILITCCLPMCSEFPVTGDGSDPRVSTSSPLCVSPDDTMATGTWSHTWPTAVWQCFITGRLCTWFHPVSLMKPCLLPKYIRNMYA